MPALDPQTVGHLLRTRRQRLGLSQPAAARRVGVSTRLWSEVERGERPNVSFATLVRMLAEVDVDLVLRESRRVSRPDTAPALPADYEQELRSAEAFGVDLSLLRTALDQTPLERLRRNDEALAVFDAITVTRGPAPARAPTNRRMAVAERRTVGLIDVLNGLAEARVKIVLVGGMAARAHGAARVTDDVDVCYDTSASNERRLVVLLRGWGASPRDLAPGHPFMLTRAHLAEHETLRLRTTLGSVDFMRHVPGIGGYREVAAHCNTLNLPNGRTLPLVNLEKLIRAKEHANRGKDHEALHELRALRALALQRELERGTDTPEQSTPRKRPKRGNSKD